jgi:ATP-dependent Clp protease adaptor protein ClpS
MSSRTRAVETDTTTTPQRLEKQKTDTRPKKLPPYAVILHNDPINDMIWVVGVLKKIFHYGTARALALMLRAHLTGKSMVWTGSLEVAELKAQQLREAGPRRRHAPPLSVTIEPLAE